MVSQCITNFIMLYKLILAMFLCFCCITLLFLIFVFYCHIFSASYFPTILFPSILFPSILFPSILFPSILFPTHLIFLAYHSTRSYSFHSPVFKHPSPFYSKSYFFCTVIQILPNLLLSLLFSLFIHGIHTLTTNNNTQTCLPYRSCHLNFYRLLRSKI